MREAGGPLGRRSYLPDVTKDCGKATGRARWPKVDLLADFVGHEPDIVQDRGEQVVEIVGDAAGKLAKTFQPVRLVKTRLQEIPSALNIGSVALTPGLGSIRGIADRRGDERALFGLAGRKGDLNG